MAGECACPAGLTECAGRCLDLKVSADACGSCDEICSEEQRCVDGRCLCEAGLQACDGECVDWERDARHCGGCFNGCEGGPCEAGQCRISAGEGGTPNDASVQRP